MVRHSLLARARGRGSSLEVGRVQLKAQAFRTGPCGEFDGLVIEVARPDERRDELLVVLEQVCVQVGAGAEALRRRGHCRQHPPRHLRSRDAL